MRPHRFSDIRFAQECYERAIKLPAGEDRLRMFESAITNDPTHGHAYLNLGADHRRRGRVTESINRLEMAVALLPTYPAALHAFGEALLADDRPPSEALPYLEAAEHLDTEYAPYSIVFGNALLGAGRINDAAAAYERAAGVEPWLGVQTGRNDGFLTPDEQVAAATSSERRWARLSEAQSLQTDGRSSSSALITSSSSSDSDGRSIGRSGGSGGGGSGGGGGGGPPDMKSLSSRASLLNKQVRQKEQQVASIRAGLTPDPLTPPPDALMDTTSELSTLYLEAIKAKLDLYESLSQTQFSHEK